jgi:hypothetical protein
MSAIQVADVPVLNQSTTGNAATATALATARDINGIAFDGTADIIVTSAAGTLTGNTLNATVVNSSLTSVGTLTDLTVTNPIAGSITGTSANVTGTVAVANGGTGLSSTTNNQLLYSSADNTIAGLATANSSVLTTDGSGVPSMSTKIDESMLPTGTMILLHADETGANGIITTADVRTFVLGANNYSRIIVEAEIAINQSAGNPAAWNFTIQYGGTNKTTIPITAQGGAGDSHDIFGVIKYSEEEKTGLTISIDVNAVTANGTWYVDGFRVYGVIE